HEPIGRGVVLVEADAVEAQLLHQGPGVQVLTIVPHRELRAEVLRGQRVGQLAVDLEVIEVLGIRQQVESEDPHWASALRFPPFFHAPLSPPPALSAPPPFSPPSCTPALP